MRNNWLPSAYIVRTGTNASGILKESLKSTMSTRKRLYSLAAIGALTLGAAFSHAAPAFADGGLTGIIGGTILDANGNAVSGADVTFSAPTGGYTTRTNSRGNFTIVGMIVGTYTITIVENGVIEVNQPGIGIVGDQIVDLGKITL